MRALSFLLATALVTACAGCPRDASDPLTLTIWSAPANKEGEAFERLCRRFERERPGIRVRNVPGLQEPRLIRALVAGAPPDLVYTFNPTLVGPLAANGAVQPLEERFRASGLKEEEFLPGAIAQGRYRGVLHGMPICRDSRALFVNRKVFREAGLDPDRPPRTWEALYDTAKRLTVRRPDGSIARLGMAPPADSALFFSSMGGRLMDERTGKATLDCPENVAALAWRVRLTDMLGGRERVAAFRSGFGATESAQNPFALGNVAMQIDGEWLPAQLAKYAPFADYGVAEIPHPAARPDLRNMAWQDGDFLTIPKGARHADAAWEFIVWMQQPRQQEEYQAAMGNLPTIRALLDSPALTTGSRAKEALGFVLKRIASNRANTRFFPTVPITRLYKDALDHAVEVAELHQKSPEAALREAQQRVQRELDRY
jgi:ABC-type glycerol-3-phosphate transport system substrate-binding protein